MAGVPESSDAKLTAVRKMVSGLDERRKGSGMGKAPCPASHDDLLMGIKVSGSQEIQDNLPKKACARIFG